MIARLLPEGVASSESFVDDGVFLYPQEARHVERAVASRRRQFATVRRCARDALASLGVTPGPLLPGHRGAPIWPPGIAGSMTHCDGYLAAAVARTADVPALGIDAEPNSPLPEAELLAMIASPPERRRLAPLALARPDVHWDRLTFCVKESTFKAWFPATGRESSSPRSTSPSTPWREPSRRRCWQPIRARSSISPAATPRPRTCWSPRSPCRRTRLEPGPRARA